MNKIKLFEKTLAQLGGITSGLTDKHKNIRYQNNDNITFSGYNYNKLFNFFQLDFQADSTFGGFSSAPSQKNSIQGRKQVFRRNKSQQKADQYTLSLRFYKINSFIPNLKQSSIQDKQKFLKQMLDTCDIKLYSSDDSWYYQGGWEAAYKQGLSIYKFPGPAGKGVWQTRHKQSGGLSGSVYISKHLSQLFDELPGMLGSIAQAL